MSACPAPTACSGDKYLTVPKIVAVCVCAVVVCCCSLAIPKSSTFTISPPFAPFASFAGTYTLTDHELIFRPLVTMNPNNMRGRPFQSIRTQWEGEDVWLIYTGVDGTQNRVRLTRVTE